MTKSKRPSPDIDLTEVIDHLHIGVMRCSLGSSAQILYANTTYYNMFHLSPKSKTAILLKDMFVHPEDLQSFTRALKKEGHIEAMEVMLRGATKSSSVWCLLSASGVYDEKKKLVAADVTIRDITERRQIQQELQESRDLFQTIFNNTAAAITVTDVHGRIIAWNSFTERLLGLTREELFNKPVAELYTPEAWKKIKGYHIKRKGLKLDIETQVQRCDQDVLDVNVSICMLKNEKGEISGAVGIIHDITRQKETKEMLLQAKLVAEQASESKSMFLANMSHEVRTPMNAIMGMLDLTLETELTREQIDNLKTAKDAADNLLGLLNDILDLSKVEAGKIKLESIEFHLPNVLQNIVKGMEVVAKDKGLGIELDLDSAVPNLVEGDPVRLRQVINNFLTNAIKFTFTGHVKLNVSSVPSDKNLLKFEMIDTGK